MYTIHLAGIVVQLVRAPPCQGGSCGFEPRQSRTRIRWISQCLSLFFAKGKTGRKMESPVRGGGFFFFCFCFAFIIRQIREFPFLSLVLMDKGRHMWIGTIGNIAIFSILSLRDTILTFFFACFWLTKWNGVPIKYGQYRHILSSFIVRYTMNLI